MREKIINSYQRCINVVSNIILFFICIGMQRYILLKFVVMLAAKIRLKKNAFISDQFGKA